MNLLASIINGFACGILICYFIINTFFSDYHALDSNYVKKILINIDNKKFRLIPYIIDKNNN